MVQLFPRLKDYLQRIDVFLLLFLTFFTIDKVVLKPLVMLPALIWIIRSIKRVDLKNAPLFYIILPVIALVQWLFVNKDLSTPHVVSFFIGTIYWLMAFMAFVVLSVRVKDAATDKIHRTLTLFFCINCLVSLWGLVSVMYQSGSINPYALEDIRYGNSTGDYVKGIFMAPCYINTFVNCAFAFYFLGRAKYKLSFVAVVLACITTSNFASLMLILLLVACLFVYRTKKARITVLLQLAFIGCFYLFVSTNNLYYLLGSLTRKTDPKELAVFENLKAELNRRLEPEGGKITSNKGKFMSLELSYYNLLRSPDRLLLGSGMGNFSSQLALNTADVQQGRKSRLFAKLPVYMANDFTENHYLIYAALYSLPEEYHSVRHMPRSFYNQVFGEYGLIGFLSFLVFYVWYFLRRAGRLKYTILIGVMLAYFLLFDYMFEYLSIVLFFELFFLIERKQNTQTTLAHDA